VGLYRLSATADQKISLTPQFGMHSTTYKIRIQTLSRLSGFLTQSLLYSPLPDARAEAILLDIIGRGCYRD
jgi:hypothetical protein